MNNNDASLLNDLSKMNYVVGYHLPIEPTNYKVEIKPGKRANTITVKSRFDVSLKDGFALPFFFLHSLFSKKKRVTDNFDVDEEKGSIKLRSSDAFFGIANWFEKGRVFRVVRTGPYLILVNREKVFVMSSTQERLSVEDQGLILDAIQHCDSSPKKLKMNYL